MILTRVPVPKSRLDFLLPVVTRLVRQFITSFLNGISRGLRIEDDDEVFSDLEVALFSLPGIRKMPEA